MLVDLANPPNLNGIECMFAYRLDRKGRRSEKNIFSSMNRAFIRACIVYVIGHGQQSFGTRFFDNLNIFFNHGGQLWSCIVTQSI